MHLNEYHLFLVRFCAKDHLISETNHCWKTGGPIVVAAISMGLNLDRTVREKSLKRITMVLRVKSLHTYLLHLVVVLWEWLVDRLR